MRLYRLLRRVGRKTSSIVPWVEDPLAVSPGEFAGWRWDNRLFEWVKVYEEPLKILMAFQLYPKPTKMPSRTFSSTQPGWSYSFTKFEWERKRVMAEPVEFEMPDSLPPGVTFAQVQKMPEWIVEWTAFQANLKALGLESHEARRIASAFLARGRELTEAHTRVLRTEAWKQFIHYQTPLLEKVAKVRGVEVAAAVIAFIMGWSLGQMLAYLTYDREGYKSMVPVEKTYLFGPDEWFYADLVSVSPKQVSYYTACENIKAINATHLRGYPGAWDRIAFVPAGFLEKGYKFPRYVVYRWEFWEILYIGFLLRSGANLYRLQEGNTDTEAPVGPYIKTRGEVCSQEFRYYL